MSLPTLKIADIRARKTAKSCYVILGTNVYDITSFLDSHPGGPELILEHGGTDVTAILADEASHKHSEAAYEVLDDCLVGSLTESDPSEIIPVAEPVYAATGMSNAEDLSRETDPTNDYKTYRFLDLNKPLFMQMVNCNFDKKFYLEQIHRPRHYKGGDSAPLFGNFLEPLSKTAWWVIPTVWLPPVAYGTFLGFWNLRSTQEAAAYWGLGLFLWTLVEYVLHRFLFHLDYYLPDNRFAFTVHFLLHGIHHYLPMDKYRLVMPPTLFLALATPFYKLAHTVFAYNWYAATTVFSGGIFGYICYDLTHYFLHHRRLPPWYQSLKKYHLAHHFADYQNGFGVTSRFWD